MSSWNRRPLIHVLAIAQFVALLLYGITVPATEAPAITHLRGVVLDEAGKPIPSAPVGIQDLATLALVRKQYPQLPLRTTTDAQGRYDLVVPKALGRVYVVSRLPGRISATPPLVVLDAAQLDLPPLRMSPGLSVQGIVLNPQRQPIAGASIFASAPLEPRYDTIGGPVHRIQVSSGSDGRFVLQGLSAWRYTLRAQANGYANWHGDSSSREQQGPLEILMSEPSYISGVVTDAAGKPLAGATLTQFNRGSLLGTLTQFDSGPLLSTHTGSKGDPLLTTTTDARGRFRLAPIAARPHQQIEVTLRGYTPLQSRVDPPENELKLVMQRNGTLRGRVLDADTQAPLQSFSITFVPGDGSTDDASMSVIRDAVRSPRNLSTRDGRFSFPDMHAGRWAAVVTAPGYALTYVPFEIPAGQSSPEILCKIPRGQTLRGRVIDKTTGKPLAGAKINFRPATPSGFSNNDLLWAYGAPDGTFSFPNLPIGEIQVSADADGYLGTQRSVDTRLQPSVTFGLGRGASISGQIFASDGVTPVTGMVNLAPLPANGSSSGRGTDAEGRFLIENYSEGRYQLLATTSTARSESQEILLAEGRPITGIRLVLQQLPTVRGTVTGLPANQPQVRLSASAAPEVMSDAHHNFPSFARTQSNAQGAYRLEGLQPGPTSVSAGSDSQYITKRVVVPESGEVSVDFDFGSRVRISGRVTRGGRPAHDLTIFAEPADGQGVSAQVNTAKNGEYAFTDLAEGNYWLTLTPLEPIRVNVERPVVRDFTVSPHDVSGSVVDAATREALSGALILLHDSSGKTHGSSTRGGRFDIDTLEAGDYDLTAHLHGYDFIQQRLTVSTSSNDLNLALSKAEGVALRLRSDGDVDSIEVSIAPAASGLSTGRLSLAKDADGIFKLPPALTGRTFKINAYKYAPLTISKWDGAPLELQLQRVDGK